MIWGLRIADETIDDERKKKNRAPYDRWINHPTMSPAIKRANAAKFTTSSRVAHQTR